MILKIEGFSLRKILKEDSQIPWLKNINHLVEENEKAGWLNRMNHLVEEDESSGCRKGIMWLEKIHHRDEKLFRILIPKSIGWSTSRLHAGVF